MVTWIVRELTGARPGMLREPLPGPRVAHFCGHRIGDRRFPADAEHRTAQAIADVLDAAPPAYAFGALACGSDILWAEALLARGAQVHVVLPVAGERFVQTSVAAAGAGWVARFHAALHAASDVRVVAREAWAVGDPLHRYSAELAMGLAVLRARQLEGEARQYAVWDGQPARSSAGTAIDVATWRSLGRQTTVVGLPGHGEPQAGVSPRGDRSARFVRATLRADLCGLAEQAGSRRMQIAETVMVALEQELDDHRAAILHKDSAHSTISLVLGDAGSAAACALGLQRAFAALDRAATGLSDGLSLRIMGHLGPVLYPYDPSWDALTVRGTQLELAWRIQPITPPGRVYITEPFAAALALGDEPVRCAHVGHVGTARDLEPMPLYQLEGALAMPAVRH